MNDDDEIQVRDRPGIYCDFCDELISRSRLSIFDLMKHGGSVVQLLEPVKLQAMMAGMMGTAQTITSVAEGIACSKECAEKLLKRFVRKRPELAKENVFIALSGQELKRLGASVDAKAYVEQSWDKANKKLEANFGMINLPGSTMPTTYDSYSKLLEAPQQSETMKQLADGTADAIEELTEKMEKQKQLGDGTKEPSSMGEILKKNRKGKK